MSHPAVPSETNALLSSLNAQRRHVLGILEGLSEEALRTPMLPSGWPCLGLVRHLAVDVERFWFRGVMAGEDIGLDDAVDDGWIVAPDGPAESTRCANSSTVGPGSS